MAVEHQLAFLPGHLARQRASRMREGLSRFDLDMLDAGGKGTDGAIFTIGRAQFHLRRDPKE